jgi:L-lactate dehydrogenase complex protein LldF
VAGRGAPTRIDVVGNAEAALRDAALQRALRGALPSFRQQRDAAVAEVPEWEALRAAAAAIKDEALRHLETHLRQFEARVAATGGTVHWAQDAAEARRIIVDLARRRGVRLAVKSKSMTSEEIDLNPALEAVGVRVVETDLGEYIVQLAGERPSHIVVPALHKDLEAIAGLFATRLGVRSTGRPQDLARVAREALRADFLAAGMGISGANFAVAETGTLVIVENEGNARLATTVPPLHVAVVSLEKVVPRLADLGVLLRLLARSATGQRASVYVSLLTGPRRAAEADGPEELHVVLLDNGRTRLLADPDLREALRCIRCGACSNVCPVFERIGGHAYGTVYSGPIGAVISPVYLGLERAGELPFASTLCGACAEVCPVKIALPRLLIELRHRAVRTRQIARLDRLLARVWTAAMASPARLRALGRAGRLLQRLMVRRGRIERLPYPLRGWTTHRTAPPLAPRAFRDGWAARARRRRRGEGPA